jgi:hypothetical protein
MYPPVEGFDAPDTRFVLENRRWRPVAPDEGTKRISTTKVTKDTKV